jgi:hypothetical protein
MKQKISNWNNYPVVDSNVKSFSFSSQLQHLHNEMSSYIVRGNGRCYGDSSLSDNIVSTLKYDKVISFDIENGQFECESGITLDQVLEIIVPKGWFLPVTPGTKFITVGGAIASDVHGKNHHVDGSFSITLQKSKYFWATEPLKYVVHFKMKIYLVLPAAVWA